MYYWLLLKLFINHFDFLKTSLSYLLLVILNIFTFLSKRTAFDSDYFLRVMRIIIGGYFRRIIHTNHLFIYRFQIILTFLRQIICKNNIINLALFLITWRGCLILKINQIFKFLLLFYLISINLSPFLTLPIFQIFAILIHRLKILHDFIWFTIRWLNLVIINIEVYHLPCLF